MKSERTLKRPRIRTRVRSGKGEVVMKPARANGEREKKKSTAQKSKKGRDRVQGGATSSTDGRGECSRFRYPSSLALILRVYLARTLQTNACPFLHVLARSLARALTLTHRDEMGRGSRAFSIFLALALPRLTVTFPNSSDSLTLQRSRELQER